MRILLVGSQGQLGLAVQRVFTRHEIIGRARQELDVCELDAVRSAIADVRPDLVLNASAYTNVDGAETDVEGAFLGNAIGPRNLALCTAERGIPIVHVSTDYVFDGEAGRPYHEFDLPAPRSVYGLSKLAGEREVRAANPRHYIVRTAWLYSARRKNFVLTMRSLTDRSEVQVVNDQFGSPTYAPHLAEALQALIETGVHGTYHLAGNGVATWYDLTCLLYRELAASTTVKPVDTTAFPRPAHRPRFSALTTFQRPRIVLPDWEDGLRACVAELRSSDG